MTLSTGLVTAGAGRIGMAVVDELLDKKIVERVMVVDSGPAPQSLPGHASFFRSDLRDAGRVAEMVEVLPEELSVVVNVLGGETQPPVKPIEDVAWPPPEVWDDTFDLNLAAVYRVTRVIVDRLVPGAAICNISSIAASMPWVIAPAYGAAKAALEHWSMSLAVLLAPQSIRVNLVRPGFVWSPQWSLIERKEFEEIVQDRVPLRQAHSQAPTNYEQTAQDIAASVAFLCSTNAAHITGQAVDVDGGANLVRAAR